MQACVARRLSSWPLYAFRMSHRVQHAVDEFPRIFRRKSLRQFDGFVDGDGRRRVGATCAVRTRPCASNSRSMVGRRSIVQPSKAAARRSDRLRRRSRGFRTNSLTNERNSGSAPSPTISLSASPRFAIADRYGIEHLQGLLATQSSRWHPVVLYRGRVQVRGEKPIS